MTDITSQISLTHAWQDITTAGGLVAGKSYSGDIIDIRPDVPVTVYQAVTDDSAPPGPNIEGHPWAVDTSRRSLVPGRRLTAVAGRTLWMRLSGGAATLVITEV